MAQPLTQDRIRDTVRLPSLPSTVQRLNALLATPDVELGDVVATLAKDPSLASRTLSIASSSYYGLPGPVVSIAQAVVVLGIRELHSIVLQACVIQKYEHLMNVPDFDLRSLWKHAILTAQLSQELGGHLADRVELTPEELYTCGLLHDIGMLALLDSARDEWLEAYRESRARKRPIWVVEAEKLGFNHLDVGGMIAETWGFAPILTAAIEGHHGPSAVYAKEPETAIVAFADRVADCVQEDEVPAPSLACMMPSARALRLDQLTAKAILESAQRNWPEIHV